MEPWGSPVENMGKGHICAHTRAIYRGYVRQWDGLGCLFWYRLGVLYMAHIDR